MNIYLIPDKISTLEYQQQTIMNEPNSDRLQTELDLVLSLGIQIVPSQLFRKSVEATRDDVEILVNLEKEAENWVK